MSNAQIRSVVEGFEDRVSQAAKYFEYVEEVLEDARPLDRSLALTAMEHVLAELAQRVARCRDQ